MASSSVIGIVAAYKRPAMLRALLQSLTGTNCLRYVIVVDNGFDSETEQVCRTAPVSVRYHRPDRNLGCGGGVAHGLQLALSETTATHFCVCDDDSEATPGALDALIEGMLQCSAHLAVPLILNDQGHISWFPGLTEPSAWKAIRRPGLTPADFRRGCGDMSIPFTWAPWPVIALSAGAVKDCGYPRDDFWLCAEDLEYTLRLTHRYRGVLVPTSVCYHRPPSSRRLGSTPAAESSEDKRLEGPHYLRFCLMLQNLSYISTRLPHARRVLRNLPGNYLRFLRTFGGRPAMLRDAWIAFWCGAVRGQPAGRPGADGFKQRFLKSSSKA